MNPHVVIFDGSNMFHRAKSGFALGDNPVVFNFFRSFKALVCGLKPTRVIVVLEGVPKARKALFENYKANRIIKESDRESHENFVRQRNIIQQMLCNNFPVSVMRHPDYEADDLIYTIVKNAATSTNFTIVSTDTDFTQMLQEFSNVKLYNQVKKKYVEPPQGYDYVTWKSLRGDASDNIPGLKGIGDIRAAELAMHPEKLADGFETNELDSEQFLRNIDLIRLSQMSENDWMTCMSSSPTRDWEIVKNQFELFDFKSMVNEKYWSEFVKVFDKLWIT